MTAIRKTFYLQAKLLLCSPGYLMFKHSVSGAFSYNYWKKESYATAQHHGTIVAKCLLVVILSGSSLTLA